MPDQAILRVNLRPATPDAMVAAEAALRDTIANIQREHDVHCHLHGGFNRPPKPLDAAATRLFELVRDCGAALDLPPIRWNATGGVCDGNNIAACGVPGRRHDGRARRRHSFAGGISDPRQPARTCRPLGAHHDTHSGTGDSMNYVIRAAKPGDLQSIYEMAKLTGGGFTNLPPDKKALRAKLERTEASFASDKEYPSDELYLLVLEDLDSGEVRGTCQVFGQVGQRWPFYSYRMGTDSKHSEHSTAPSAQILMLSNDLNGRARSAGCSSTPRRAPGGSGCCSRARAICLSPATARALATASSRSCAG